MCVSQTVKQVLAGFCDALKPDNSLTIVYIFILTVNILSDLRGHTLLIKSLRGKRIRWLHQTGMRVWIVWKAPRTHRSCTESDEGAHTQPRRRREHVCACRLRTMDGWYAVHFSLFSIAAYNLSRSYHSPFQNNQMPAGYVGLLSFGFCFRKGCYYSQMGCVLLQTRQTLSRAPVSTSLYNERLEQRGGRKEDHLYSMKPQVWFYPFKHPFFLSFFLVFFHSSFPFSPGRNVFIWFTNADQL